MIFSYADAAYAFNPAAKWSMTNNYEYSTLNWISTDIEKPTQQQLDDEIIKLNLQAPLNSCKQQASALLSQTDWTTIADVADPTKSQPYLLNQAEFTAYRSAVRVLAVYPVADPVWPVKPTEQWSSI
jgi:hypothetical protein